MLAYGLTYLSLNFLCLVKIIPACKSSLLDRLGLVLWTAVTVGLATGFLWTNRQWIEAEVDRFSVFSLFRLGSSTFVPCVQVVATFPAVYHLVTSYPSLLLALGRSAPALSQPWLFLVDMGLSCARLTGSLLQACPSNPEADQSTQAALEPRQCHTVITIISIIYVFSMKISTFVLGVAAARFKANLDNGDRSIAVIDPIFHATTLNKELQDLKAGLSPLLFLNFSTKCVILIEKCVGLLAYPKWLFSVTVLYTLVDLFYAAVVLGETYDSFKSYTLSLR